MIIKELRSGCLIRYSNHKDLRSDYRGKVLYVTGNVIDNFENNSRLDFYEPIEITNDILEAVGFVKIDGDCHFLPLNDIGNGFGLYYPGFIQLAQGNSPIMNFQYVKHLHQLQNLIFILTGIDPYVNIQVLGECDLC